MPGSTSKTLGEMNDAITKALSRISAAKRTKLFLHLPGWKHGSSLNKYVRAVNSQYPVFKDLICELGSASTMYQVMPNVTLAILGRYNVSCHCGRAIYRGLTCSEKCRMDLHIRKKAERESSWTAEERAAFGGAVSKGKKNMSPVDREIWKAKLSSVRVNWWNTLSPEEYEQICAANGRRALSMHANRSAEVQLRINKRISAAGLATKALVTPKERGAAAAKMMQTKAANGTVATGGYSKRKMHTLERSGKTLLLQGYEPLVADWYDRNKWSVGAALATDGTTLMLPFVHPITKKSTTYTPDLIVKKRGSRPVIIEVKGFHTLTYYEYVDANVEKFRVAATYATENNMEFRVVVATKRRGETTFVELIGGGLSTADFMSILGDTAAERKAAAALKTWVKLPAKKKRESLEALDLSRKAARNAIHT